MASRITSSYTTLQPAMEDLDTSKPEKILSKVKAKTVLRPRSQIKHTAECNQSDIVTSMDQTNTESDTHNSKDDNCESPPPKPSPLGSTHETANDTTVSADASKQCTNTSNKSEVKRSTSLPRPERPPPPSAYYGRLVSSLKSTPTTSDNEDCQESVDSSASSNQQSPVSLTPSDKQENLFGIYRPLTSNKSEVKRSTSLPRPERPPPPSAYYGRLISSLKSTPTTSDNEDCQESVDSSASSNQQSPVSLTPSDEQENLFGIYQPLTEESQKPAVPPRPPQPKQPYMSSASLPSQNRPPPPCFSPPPPPSETDPLYSEIHFPPYLHVLPEHDDEMVNSKGDKSTNTLKKLSINSRYHSQRSNTAYTEETMEMLRWLKIVSKGDFMAPSLYGASIEEEIRSFHQTALNLKKALRLFNLLMMKRNEAMRDHISELTSVSDGVDKALKKEKTINIAGGTTGAVGGVTAVVGIALAPVTLGASLIATAVGAGMVASAGGVSAHAAKANKKAVTRTAVDELINDYTEKVVDIEHCLNFILSGMNELRRYDIARLQRAGAQLDALKVAHLTQSVFNNINNFKKNPVANTGGMSSERLLQGFAKEMDDYFKEKNKQKLRKSRKSRFSGRVRLLAENLQDELDYLNHMWELFN